MTIRFNLESPGKRAQFCANVEFAREFATQLTSAAGLRRREPGVVRVVVSGFGRFLSHKVNASEQIVRGLLTSAEREPEALCLREPLAKSALSSVVQCPWSQTYVATTRLMLDATPVELCVIVLPVFWDLAPWMLLQTIAAFSPAVVIMNGIAGERQPLWLESRALNRAKLSEDASGHIVPLAHCEAGGSAAYARLLPELDDLPEGRALCCHFDAVRIAAERAFDASRNTPSQGVLLSDILQSIEQQPTARESNIYLCNSVAYLTDVALSEPDRSLSFFQDAAEPLSIALKGQCGPVARWFAHWPSGLAEAHIAPCASILRAMIAAEVGALLR